MDKNERERKQLNRKLIWNTFISECKEKKRSEIVFELLFEIISFFIAISLSEFLLKKMHIEFWLVELVLFVVFMWGINLVKGAAQKTFLRIKQEKTDK